MSKEGKNIEPYFSSSAMANQEGKSSRRIIISGGGTGGHIFPAIAIANALKAIDETIDILFVGAEDRMEMEKVPAAGYKIIGLPVAGFYRKQLYKNFQVIIKLINSLLLAWRIIKNYKPDIVIGVGGYASGPMLWMASRAKIPTFIQEQNSYAGITNKILSKKVNKIFVAYGNMHQYFPSDKLIIAGNPVRQGLENTSLKKNEAIEYFGLDPNKKVILSIGGSLGARTINQSISKALKLLGNSNVQFIWQCGPYYLKDAQKALVNSGIQNVKLFDFISRMDLAYAAADVIISRAGASSISELCIVGKPVILVPSPNVAEDHQTKNAMALVNIDAALMIPDVEAKENLINELLKLLTNEELCGKLSNNIRKLALYNSAENIAREILRSV
jgi:UDP-N-acetylglucosamine--N-acetylmuramyl-(pentapeptide) pyrophosphoryl-undecaprenol N-acetylglucosamine transferase